MSLTCGGRQRWITLLLGMMAVQGSVSIRAQDWKKDDFRWMHGANYVASYAATDVEMWLRYDHAVIDRELGYAQKMGLNCVRVFLQSLVYHHEPKAFLARFEDFLATADKHGLKVMPILFDSCFGVAPSLESRHIWVANPGPGSDGKGMVAGVGCVRDGGRVGPCGRQADRAVGRDERTDRHALGGHAGRQGVDRRVRGPLLRPGEETGRDARDHRGDRHVGQSRRAGRWSTCCRATATRRASRRFVPT